MVMLEIIMDIILPQVMESYLQEDVMIPVMDVMSQVLLQL